VPVLLSGKADLVMATFSITPERAKSVAFSNPYGIIRSVVFGAKDVAIRTAADMRGKRIGVTRGTTQEGALAETAPAGTNITRFDDDATAISALASGQVDALATADNRGFVLNQRFPDRFEVKYELGVFYYGVGLRRGDPDLQHWLDTWVFVNLHNGNLGRIFSKWLKADLPMLPAM
jgi:polar amino acid transport system substrate-binding protein